MIGELIRTGPLHHVGQELQYDYNPYLLLVGAYHGRAGMCISPHAIPISALSARMRGKYQPPVQ